MRPIHLLPVLFMALLAFSSCGEKEFIAPDSSYGLIYTNIFQASCAVRSCHGQERKNDLFTPPLLQGADVYAAIVNGAADNLQASAAGLKLITPNDPDASFLYQKVIYDSSAFQFGAKMPSGALSLSTNAIAFIRQWIEAGAPETGHVADKTLFD